MNSFYSLQHHFSFSVVLCYFFTDIKKSKVMLTSNNTVFFFFSVCFVSASLLSLFFFLLFSFATSAWLHDLPSCLLYNRNKRLVDFFFFFFFFLLIITCFSYLAASVLVGPKLISDMLL